jgi:hypothetical protein
VTCLFADESGDRWWVESAVPPAPAVAAVPPQRPSMSTSINATSIARDSPSATPPRHHLAKEGEFPGILSLRTHIRHFCNIKLVVQ